jgi:ATP-dependent helicase HrpA
VMVRDIPVGLDYDVEEIPGDPVTVQGIVWLVLPEKLGRTLVAEELPVLDRPVRFLVRRGQRGTVRGATLDALQELLDRPWSPEESSRRQEREDQGRRKHRNREGSRPKGEVDRHRKARERSRVSPQRRRGKR